MLSNLAVIRCNQFSTLGERTGPRLPHDLCVRAGKAPKAQTPMTLAETASIMCNNCYARRTGKGIQPRRGTGNSQTIIQGEAQVIVDMLSR